MAHAAGVIVFHQKENELGELEYDQVLMVETKRVGNWGFPKGGHEKGEVWHQTAIRELQEESGVTIDQIKILDDYEKNSVKELTPKGNIGVQYLIASLIVPKEDVNLKAMVIFVILPKLSFTNKK